MDESHILILMVDEAKSIYSRLKEATVGGVSNIDTLTAINRHGNIRVIAADQEISKLSNSLLNSASRSVYFHQNSGKDAEEISRAILLTPEQREELMRLDTGVAIIKDGRNSPILVQVLPFDAMTEITEDDVARRLSSFLQPFEMSVVPWIGEQFSNTIVDLQPKVDFEQRVLEELCKAPLSTLNQLVANTDCTRATLGRVIDSLETKGVLKRVTPLNFRQGGARQLFEPTPKGRRLITELDLSYVRQGICGLEAFFYLKEMITSYYEKQEFSVTMEPRCGSDLLVEGKGKCIAVEFELTAKNAARNLIRNSKAVGIDEVVVICKDESVAKQTLSEIDQLASHLLLPFEVKLLKGYAV